MSSSVRIPTLPVTEWTPEAYEALAMLGPAATLEVAQKNNLVMVLANHPKLAKAFYTFGGHVLVNNTLPPRLREIVTLRVSWHFKAEYEWHQHVRTALLVGVTDAEIEATKQDIETVAWPEAERCVLRVADKLCTHSKIDDATWSELSKFLDRSQIIDLAFTVANYVMCALTLPALGIEIEPECVSKAHPLS